MTKSRNGRIRNHNNDHLRRSDFTVFMDFENTHVAFNSFFGTPVILDDNAVRLFQLFTEPTTLQDLAASYEIEEAERWINFFLHNRLLVPADMDEQGLVAKETRRALNILMTGERLESLGLILDEACNFNCTYCISKKMLNATGRSKGRPSRMNWRTAQTAIDAFMHLLREHGRTKAEIYFGGSEPLLNWEVLTRAINYCARRYGDIFQITFSTNTNGSLVTYQRAQYLAQHNVTLTTSLDGNESGNNAVRITNDGKGSYALILKGWENLRRAGIGPSWFCLTLTDANIDYIEGEFFDDLISRGITSCSIEPDLINPLRIEPAAVVKKLMYLKNEAEKRGILVGGMWEKPYKNLYQPSIRKRIFNCSAFTGRGISVLPDGRVVPCSYSASVIGHINALPQIFHSSEFKRLLTSRAIGSIPECRGCELEGRCIGGCYITPEYASARGTSRGFEYRCEIYKKATRSLLQATIGKADNPSGKEV